ncbi:hypothetical protein S301_13155 [Salmonella enterica subsp. enterica]|uniref:Uncharacterized protein n=1 Tax=Salmonella enterica I TaxID=59201 RepID=A0A5U3ES86_SALET|nr:hypothetical protein [Salmonella enterica subsp. enterica]
MMNKQPDNHQMLTVYNSYFTEFMTERLNQRMINLLIFAQVVLSSAIMADVAHTFVAGLFIAVISAFLLVYKPGEKAGNARIQSRRYERLIHRINAADTCDVPALLIEYAEFDSEISGSLIRPAYIRAMVACGKKNDEIQMEISRLTRTERLVAWFSGGIPV